MNRLDLPQYLATRIAPDSNGCWLWTAYRDKKGYGHTSTGLAHRATYEAVVGPIPAGLQLDHLCRVRSCVNPAHLEPVTCRENLMRGDTFAARNAARTECIRGHAFDEDNTLFDRFGHRHCKECRDTAYPRNWKVKP